MVRAVPGVGEAGQSWTITEWTILHGNEQLKKKPKYFHSISCELSDLQARRCWTGRYHRGLWAGSSAVPATGQQPKAFHHHPISQLPHITCHSSQVPRVWLAVKMWLTQLLSGSFELKSECKRSSSRSSPTRGALLCGPLIIIPLVEVVVSEKQSDVASLFLNFTKVHFLWHLLSPSLWWKLSKNINQTHSFGWMRCLWI